MDQYQRATDTPSQQSFEELVHPNAREARAMLDDHLRLTGRRGRQLQGGRSPVIGCAGVATGVCTRAWRLSARVGAQGYNILGGCWTSSADNPETKTFVRDDTPWDHPATCSSSLGGTDELLQGKRQRGGIGFNELLRMPDVKAFVEQNPDIKYKDLRHQIHTVHPELGQVSRGSIMRMREQITKIEGGPLKASKAAKRAKRLKQNPPVITSQGGGSGGVGAAVAGGASRLPHLWPQALLFVQSNLLGPSWPDPAARQMFLSVHRARPTPGVVLRKLGSGHKHSGSLGAFAQRAFAPGEHIVQFTGLLKPRQTVNHGNKNLVRLSLAEGPGELDIDAEHGGNESRFVNHFTGIATQPNVQFCEKWSASGHLEVWVVAGQQGIAQGSELLHDYGNIPTSAHAQPAPDRGDPLQQIMCMPATALAPPPSTSHQLPIPDLDGPTFGASSGAAPLLRSPIQTITPIATSSQAGSIAQHRQPVAPPVIAIATSGVSVMPGPPVLAGSINTVLAPIPAFSMLKPGGAVGPGHPLLSAAGHSRPEVLQDLRAVPVPVSMPLPGEYPAPAA